MAEEKVGKKAEEELGEGGKGTEEQEVGGKGRAIWSCWDCGRANVVNSHWRYFTCFNCRALNLMR